MFQKYFVVDSQLAELVENWVVADLLVVLAQQLQVVSMLVGVSQFLCFESVQQVGPLLQIAELQELVLPSVCCLVLL